MKSDFLTRIGQIYTYYNQNLTDFLYASLFSNPLIFTCVVLCIYSFISKAREHSLIGAWCVNFLGVFFHELAHALVALLLNGKPTKFVILPKIIHEANGGKTYVLGHVDCKNIRWYNAFPIAMAPLLLLFFAFQLEKLYWEMPFVEHSLFFLFFYVYLQIIFVINAIPSSVDFQHAFKNPFGVILWVCLFFSFQNII